MYKSIHYEGVRDAIRAVLTHKSMPYKERNEGILPFDSVGAWIRKSVFYDKNENYNIGVRSVDFGFALSWQLPEIQSRFDGNPPGPRPLALQVKGEDEQIALWELGLLRPGDEFPKNWDVAKFPLPW